MPSSLRVNKQRSYGVEHSVTSFFVYNDISSCRQPKFESLIMEGVLTTLRRSSANSSPQLTP
jgi:hypothetical protein